MKYLVMILVLSSFLVTIAVAQSSKEFTIPSKIPKNIDAGNVIYSPANVIYRAPGKINFLPGFKIENGATFKTETGSCAY